jgi:hypothetical protein
MKELGQRMEKRFGPGSDFERRLKERIDDGGKGLDEKEKRLLETIKGRTTDTPLPSVEKKPSARPTPNPSRRPSGRSESSRERRIKDMESRIDRLMLELKELKAGRGGDDDEPGAPTP